MLKLESHNFHRGVLWSLAPCESSELDNVSDGGIGCNIIPCYLMMLYALFQDFYIFIIRLPIKLYILTSGILSLCLHPVCKSTSLAMIANLTLTIDVYILSLLWVWVGFLDPNMNLENMT